MIAGFVLAVAVGIGVPADGSMLIVAQAEISHKPAESDIQKPPADAEQALQKWNELRAEYDRLQAKAEDLQRQLDAAQQEIASGKKTLADVNGRLAVLEKEKNQAAAALTEARDQAKDLAAKLAAEQVKSATLREDKQRLMSGATTAKEEIAKLQKHASELETEAARADNLTKRLAERDQEIERLRKAAADRETLANKITALTDKLERSKQRVTTLTDELTARSEDAARARQERDQLLLELQKQRDALKGADGNGLMPTGRTFSEKPHDRLNLEPIR